MIEQDAAVAARGRTEFILRNKQCRHNPNLQLNVMLQTAEQLTALTCLITPNKLKVLNLIDSLPSLLYSQASISIASTVKVTKGFS